MSGMDDRNVHACKWYKKVFPDNDELGCKSNEEILFITIQDKKQKAYYGMGTCFTTSTGT